MSRITLPALLSLALTRFSNELRLITRMCDKGNFVLFAIASEPLFHEKLRT